MYRSEKESAAFLNGKAASRVAGRLTLTVMLLYPRISFWFPAFPWFEAA